MPKDEDFDKRFVAVWLVAIDSGENAYWIAEQLRVTKTYVINKAQTLRKRGVKLPHLKSGNYSISPSHVEELNNIIEGTE